MDKMNLTDAMLIFKLEPPFNLDRIQKRYRELLLKYHPDKNHQYSDWCHQRMTEIADAQNILKEHADNNSIILWDNHYQKMPEIPEEEEIQNNQGNTFGLSEFLALVSMLFDNMETYYHYGLENIELRQEGIRRFRFREVIRNFKRLEAQLSPYYHEGINRSVQKNVNALYRFIKDAYMYYQLPFPAQDLSGTVQIRRAFIAIRDASTECEKVMKDFFMDKIEQPPLQRFYAAMQIIIVLSGTYKNQPWTETARFFINLAESFLEWLNRWQEIKKLLRC